MEKPRYDAVIFDLDGTLLDTLDDIADALNATLSQEGCKLLDRSEAKELVGYGIRELVRCAFLGHPMDEAALERRVKLYRAEYGKRVDAKARLYDGIAETLDRIVAAGVRLSMYSNKSDRFTQALAVKYFAKWPFVRVQGDVAGKPLKPDPTVALEMAKAMRVPPERVAFVGDSETDVRTGRAAGMAAVAVLWGFRDRARLEAAGAEVFASTPEELRKILGV